MTDPALEIRDLAYVYPDGQQALFGVDLHKDTPDRLNTALVAGDLDIGPI